MRRWVVPVTLLLIFVGTLGFLVVKLISFQGENTKLTRINKQLQQSIDAEPVALFFIKSTTTNFYLKPYLTRINGKGDRHRKALEALLAGPPSNSNLLAVFPAGTRVLDLQVKNGLATVNLNHKATELNVGSQGEDLAVASIVNTLTKFPDVFGVKIVIEGKEVESLAGHVDLTDVLRYNDRAVEF